MTLALAGPDIMIARAMTRITNIPLRTICAPVLFGGLIALAACSGFPEIEIPPSAAARGAAYPRIVPIEGLMIMALGPRTGSGERAAPATATALTQGIAAHVARLKARAALMRGAPVDAETRARLAAAG